MLSFRPLQLADLPVVTPCFAQSGTRLCDHSASLVMWRNFLGIEIGIGGEALYIKQNYEGILSFMPPVGGDFYAGMETLLSYCRANRSRALFTAVSDGELAKMRQRYQIISAEPMRDWFDYLYESRDLIELSGRRFHGQRNHISRFDREYPNHLFEPLTDTPAVRDFIGRYYVDHPPADVFGQAEQAIVYEVLDNYDTYGFIGGVLTVNGAVVSVSIGEIVGDTLHVHIEKADSAYAGAYQKTVNMFACTYGANVRYINREEDVGRPGLRTSKLSYHPVALLEKYFVEVEL